jgi:hypothetical protein
MSLGITIYNNAAGGGGGSTPFGVLFKTIEPSQYTSYRTGDEGWRVQNGFFDYIPPSNPAAVAELDYTSPNYFNVLKNNLVVNGVSSKTRFVDVNGIQAFSSSGNADLVVIDKLTGLMFTRTNVTSSQSWNAQIDSALSYNITVKGTHYNDWYLASSNEYKLIHHCYAGISSSNDTLTGVLLFNVQDLCHTSTTYPFATTNDLFFYRAESRINAIDKATSLFQIFVTNARNLITAP